MKEQPRRPFRIVSRVMELVLCKRKPRVFHTRLERRFVSAALVKTHRHGQIENIAMDCRERKAHECHAEGS